VGSIDPASPVTLASLFYPTNYPTSRHRKIGPGARENRALSDAANRFKSHNQYNNHASPMVMGHADVRGLKKYNLKLAVELVKSYLVSQGFSPDQIKTRAEGKQHELSKKEVSTLETEDPPKPEQGEEETFKSNLARTS
jgi:OmpA family protein